MDVTLTPSRLSGAVTPPASKSQAHRALIAGALAQGESKLHNLTQSQDIEATQSCLTQLKEAKPGSLPLLDCGESGSTLRFLIPVALALLGGARFTGRGRLMERPQQPYFQLFEEKGISYHQSNGVLTVEGKLTAGTYPLAGNVSSQFLTGLMFALTLLEGDSTLALTTPLESRGYVDLTIDVLSRFGITVTEEKDGSFHIPGGQTYQPRELTIEADWSQAGFWYGANFLDNGVDIRGMNPDSAQGDKQIALWYWQLARPGEVTLDVSQCPDLVPPVAAMAAVRNGTTHLINAARLRIKESDRLSAVTAALNALGAKVEERADSLTIQGQPQLAGGATVDSCNDHRIAMMTAIAATKCLQPVTILGAECVQKSYPGFWADYVQLGGKVDGLVSG